jgi:hypothetical protein
MMRPFHRDELKNDTMHISYSSCNIKLTFHCFHVILYCTPKQRFKHLSKLCVSFQDHSSTQHTSGLHSAILHGGVADLHCKLNGGSAIRTSGFCLAVVFVRRVLKSAKSDSELRHVCTSVCLSFRMEQLGSHWMEFMKSDV